MSRITQKGATGPLALVANGAFQTTTDSSLETLLGCRWDLSDGREVILVQPATGTTVAAGKVYADPAIISNHENLAVTAFTAYSANGNVPPKVTVTLGATAVTANQYAGGFVVVNDEVGEGQTLRIASHPAADASASLAITLEDGPITALTTASQVSLIPAHGNAVIINPTTQTNVPVGVGLYTIAAGAYGFLTSRGITSVLGDGTPAAGAALSPSNAVAGALEGFVAAQGFAGNAVQTFVDTEYRAAFVQF